MSVLQFEKIAKSAIFRVLLLGVMGAITFLFPKFLEKDVVYVIAGYAILNGVLGIIDFVQKKGEEEKIIYYLNVFVAGLSITGGIICIIYCRYLASIQPVFLGVLLVIEGIVYFVAALCVKSKLKVLLVFIALLVAFGGVTLMLFTFGFGGLMTLSKMFGSLLFLSCINELLIYSVYKKIVKIGDV